MKISEKQENQILKNLDEKLKTTFTKKELDELARDSKFYQRSTNRISRSLFLNLLVFNCESLKEQSLNDICRILDKDHKVKIEKQSLQDKFSSYALTFLKTVLEQCLKNEINIKINHKLKGINRILLKDSTSFQLPEGLSGIYPGSGGSSSKAAVRIQFEYDILTGKM